MFRQTLMLRLHRYIKESVTLHSYATFTFMLFMRIGWTQSDSYQYGEVKKIKLFYHLQVFTNKYLKINYRSCELRNYC